MAVNSPGTAGADPAGALYRRVEWRILAFLVLERMTATYPNPEAPGR